MSEFQSVLAAAFEAGPAEVPELTIDQLDGRLVSDHAHETMPVLPTGPTICRAEQPALASTCVTRVERPEPVSVAAVAG